MAQQQQEQSPLAQMVAQRRQALYGASAQPDRGGDGLWGLALSGGGIRSAVFGLGLVKALARAEVLSRFDVLSTVSGGGYIGAALGRLYDQAGPATATDTAAAAATSPSTAANTASSTAPATPAAPSSAPPSASQIQAQLASADTRWFTWWLRANGRYLIAQRANGAVYALAIYLRNLLAIHVEIGMLGLLLGAVLALLNLGLWSGWQQLWPGLHTPLQQWAWLPTLWGVLPGLSVLAIVCACAYWSVGEAPQHPSWRRNRLRGLGIWALIAAACAWAIGGWGPWWPQWLRHYPWLAHVGLNFSGVWMGGHLLALSVVRQQRHHLARTQSPQSTQGTQGTQGSANPMPEHALGETLRRQLTKPLEWIGQLSVAVLLLGALDRLAWYLVFEDGSLTLFGGALGLLGLVVRAGLNKLTQSSAQPAGWRQQSALLLGHLAGLALLAMLCVLWVSVAYALVIRYDEYRSGAQILAGGSALAALLLAGTCVGYMLVTGGNVEFLNLSSLHGFYRSRLVRAFLGAANGARFNPQAPGLASALAPVEPGWLPQLHAVRREHSQDDVPMQTYAPQRHGGPVHLLTACANETLDRPDGLLNQDRRGQPLTIAPGGHVRLGLGPWCASSGASAQTLGGWMAVSGAALAPGMGGMTRTGLAVLSMVAGLRLGYWWDSTGLQSPPAAGLRHLSAWQRWPLLRKTRLLTQELLGWFNTGTDRYWFLSDGGHFENTGAYALLAERARLIVVADCGADPHYAFADLENLVRKARIDLQANITFLRPRANVGTVSATNGGGALPDHMVGSLDDLAASDTEACIAVARIRYSGGKEEGVMIVVKPNLCTGLPVDLINFKRDHPDFPQQASTDQSFDEAQWESYFTLGEALGTRLTQSQRLEQLGQGSVSTALEHGFEPDTALSHSASQASARLPARAMSAAMTASLSVGAIATTALGLWQTLDGLRSERDKSQTTQRNAVQQLVDAYANNTDGARILGSTAAKLVGLAATQDGQACNEADTAWFRRSAIGQCVLQDALQRCHSAQPTPLLCHLLEDEQVMNCLRDGPQASGLGGRVRYWGVQEDWPAAAEDCGAALPNLASAAAAQLAGPQPPTTREAAPNPDGSAKNNSSSACQGITIFNQIYDAQSRDDVRSYRQSWQAQGARLPPIVSVVREARRSGHLAPQPPSAVTFIAHDLAAQACANTLAGKLPQPSQMRALPDGMRAIPNTLEVRWPPTQP